MKGKSMHRYQRNIRLYTWFATFSEPLFWGTVLVSALQNLGHMSLADINRMEAIALIVCALCDVPAGMVADRIGRKYTLVIARLFLLVSYVYFATMRSSVDVWMGNILWAIGYSLQSGADTSLLYESLHILGREDRYKQKEGRATGMRFALTAVCSLATGILASIDLRLPILVGIPFVAIPLFIACFFTETRSRNHYSDSHTGCALRQKVSLIRHREIVWVTLFGALLATSSKVWFFNYNPYFEAVGLHYVEFGIVFALLNVVAGISSMYAHTIERALGEELSVIGMILCVGMPIVLMGVMPYHAFAYVVLMQNIVRGFMRPFIGDYINRRVPDAIRATTLSVQSTTANTLSIGALLAYGYLLERTTLFYSLTVLGSVTLGLGLFLYMWYKNRIWRK